MDALLPYDELLCLLTELLRLLELLELELLLELLRLRLLELLELELLLPGGITSLLIVF